MHHPLNGYVGGSTSQQQQQSHQTATQQQQQHQLLHPGPEQQQHCESRAGSSSSRGQSTEVGAKNLASHQNYQQQYGGYN